MSGRVMGQVLAVAAIVSGGALAGCGDDFEGQPGTGGNAGTSGASGASGQAGASGVGGASGSGGFQACGDSSECDDGLACNGLETCVGGTCQAGTPPCENPDPAHCSVTCIEPTGSCSVSANDSDQDQHKDAKCAADPGDDCDDASATTHPGAAEECDGKDNDCDGLDDLKDGHMLAGLAKTIVSSIGFDAYDPEVAWCPDAGTYVVVWVDTRDGSPNIYGATLSPQGIVGTPKRISPSGNENDPRIACTGGQCAVVWKRDVLNDVLLRPIDCTAAPTGPAVSIPEAGTGAAHLAPTLAPFGGDWLVAFAWKGSGLQSSIRKFGLDGVAKGPPQVIQSHTNLTWETSLATTSTHAALVTSITIAGGSPLVVEWTGLDQNLTPSPTQALTPKPPPSGEASRGAEVTVHGSNFVVAWRHTAPSGASLHFTERSATGGNVCDTPTLGSLVDPRVGGIVSHPSAALVAAVSGSGPAGVSMQLMRVQDCKLLDTHVLATNLALQTPRERSLAIASGSQGYATVFAIGNDNQRIIQARVFGPNLCD